MENGANNPKKSSQFDGSRLKSTRKTRHPASSEPVIWHADAKPKADQGQGEKSCSTYVAQIGHNLPDSCFVQVGKRSSVFPKELSKIPELAELRLNIQSVVLFPTVDVRKNIWMSSVWSVDSRICVRQVLQDVDLLS